jgi:hypothetical protein
VNAVGTYVFPDVLHHTLGSVLIESMYFGNWGFELVVLCMYVSMRYSILRKAEQEPRSGSNKWMIDWLAWVNRV